MTIDTLTTMQVERASLNVEQPALRLNIDADGKLSRRDSARSKEMGRRIEELDRLILEEEESRERERQALSLELLGHADPVPDPRDTMWGGRGRWPATRDPCPRP